MTVKKKIQEDQRLQFLIGIGLILMISFICYLFINVIGYHIVALILLLTVSVLAMFFKIWPVVTVAVLSALIWNFLFIQPRSTFSITTPEDALFFLMYFVIAVMNAVFTTKIRKAEEVSRRRKERENEMKLYNTFLNSLSHELRTPISTIIGSIDTLKENSTKLSLQNKIDLFTEIEIAGHRLNKQVGNLLNMSLLESEFVKLQLDWYDINEIIYSIIQLNESEAINHNIHFEADEELPLFKIDAVLFEQILQNILNNALQYTPPNSVITIQTSYNLKECIIHISDNGKGFPEDKIEKVFDKFYRLPNTATGGTGLGLSIAQGFAQAHNGTLSLENLKTGGAKFTLKIPAELAHPKNFNND
ncbi:ATP-binding protein [Antarcticibacterium sp. 1MA-6-2]|uniref:sensor histidine kinase n=1 Tax=Antarcticibacterium sp. 1MA-6-2 TaxID=2908210 RepID=UPI001F17F40E|nr:ATP-binding protein [Antarcticibacterium sp. 1MA-6-2]UJH90582.1 ATP-binding protein [Antarcticibacterium sp. 1MA-6-2]